MKPDPNNPVPKPALSRFQGAKCGRQAGRQAGKQASSKARICRIYHKSSLESRITKTLACHLNHNQTIQMKRQQACLFILSFPASTNTSYLKAGKALAS